MFFRHKKSKIPKYLICALLCLFILGVLPSEGIAASKKKGFTISARSVIFSDSTRVKRLYGKNVHKKVIPASTVKVMTALLVLEKLPLNKIVTVSKRATKPQPSKIYARQGERYRVADLLLAILIGSANDASVVLAEAVAGSEWKFVNMMNQRAKELGCRHTKFANSHGLPTKQKQYTTAYDMYVIFMQALKHPFFKKAIQYKKKTIRSQGGRKIVLKNHNKSLFKKWKRNVYGKTGYTRKAKACFVGYIEKGKSILIIAIFGCASGRRWNEVKHIITKYGGIAL